MTVQALAWVLEREATTSGSDRLVLLSLANHANDQHEAWPAIETIQREAAIKRRQTVKDALGRLTEHGLIARKVNGCPDNRVPADRRANLYRLAVDGAALPTGPEWITATGARETSPRGHGKRADGGTESVATGARETSPEPLLGHPSDEPPGEPAPAPADALFHVEHEEPDDPATRVLATGERVPGFEFADWYREFPLHKARGAAERAYGQARRKATAEQLVEGAKAYARAQAAPGAPYTCHPATWLNQERWLDEATTTSKAGPKGGAGWGPDAGSGQVQGGEL